MNKISNLWQKIIDLGYTEDLSYINRIRLKILNQQGFYVVIIVLLFILKTILENEDDIILLFIILLLSFGVNFLNYKKKYLTAKIYWMTFFPALMMGMITLYGSALRGEVTFFIFLVTALIFFDRKILRYIFVAFAITLFLISIFYTKNFESPYASITDEIDTILIFLITALCMAAIINTFSSELRKHIKNLEVNNVKLTTAYEEIERFAYISSHNLKTPIRTIRSFTDLISRDLKREKTDHLEEYLDYIKMGSKQMQFLVNDILEYSKLNQTSEIEITAIDPNKLIQQVYSQLENISEKPIELTTHDLPIFHSNQTLVHVVFQNLLENCAKYNNNDTIRIEINYSLSKDNHIFSIKDNGIGIEEKYHGKIFNMFERLNNENLEGSGIGLAMNKKIVEKLGGQIWLSSALNQGSTFYFSIPNLPLLI